MGKVTYQSLFEILDSKATRVFNAQATLVKAVQDLVVTLRSELSMPPELCMPTTMDDTNMLKVEGTTLRFKIAFHFPLNSSPFKTTVEGLAHSKSDGIYFEFSGHEQLLDRGSAGYDYRSIADRVIVLLNERVLKSADE